jgi:hypothetical protein
MCALAISKRCREAWFLVSIVSGGGLGNFGAALGTVCARLLAAADDRPQEMVPVITGHVGMSGDKLRVIGDRGQVTPGILACGHLLSF